MSEDAVGADLGDGSRGERRRALRAERERQAHREAQGEQAQEPPMARPHSVPLQGHEAAVLVGDARGTGEADGSPGGAAAEPPHAGRPSDQAGDTPDAGVPSLFAPDAEAPSPPARRPRSGPLPFDLPPFALPSDPEPSEWSAFTPVIPPEPLTFDDRRPTAWERREPWTSPVAVPAESWMALPSPELAEPDAEVRADSPARDSVWTVPTPQDGVVVEPASARDLADERDPARPADVATPAARSADLSRVELFRSALEDLAQAPGEADRDRPAEELSADELPAHEPTTNERPQHEPPEYARPVEVPPEELPAAEEPPHEEASTDEFPVTRFDMPQPSSELSTSESVPDEPAPGFLSDDVLASEVPSSERSSSEWLSDELTSSELAASEPTSSELAASEPTSSAESPGRELADQERANASRFEPSADPDTDDADASEGTSLVEQPAERPDLRAFDDEEPDAPPTALGPPPVAPAPAPAPPAPPAAPPRPDDTHLPPLGRQAFGRAPTNRLAEALAHGEGPHPSEDDEPLRGTVAPVLRRSTERVRYPTSTMPVIRPPVMPPTPGSGIQIAPVRRTPVSWQQALSGDVVPQGKKRKPRGTKVSKPRHESGGVGEYRPKVAADRSLTLLVVAMLLVLAGLVAAAVWTFWPTVTGGARSLPSPGAPRAVGGP